jgi:hypothetical protein
MDKLCYIKKSVRRLKLDISRSQIIYFLIQVQKKALVPLIDGLRLLIENYALDT